MEDSDLEPGEKDPLVESKDQEPPKSIETSSNQLSCTRERESGIEKTPKRDTNPKNGTLSPNPKRKKQVRTEAMLPNICEPDEKEGPVEEGSLLCPFFGVRNYLHHFYEKSEVKNIHMYEDAPLPAMKGNEAIFLIKRRDGICSSSVFRLSLMLGGLILLMGTTALIVAACASRRATLVGKVGGVAVVDRVAAAHNAEVDALLLVALIALTLGATVVAAALISRAFCRRPEYEDAYRDGVLSGYDTIYEHRPFLNASSVRQMPFTEQITQIQPWISSSHINFN